MASNSADTTQYPQFGRSFQQLKEDIAQSIMSVQEPHHLISLMSYTMPLYGAISTVIDAGIFQRLAASPSPITAIELAEGLANASSSGEVESSQDTRERAEYIARLLRAMTALRLVDETGPSTWTANDLTRVCADPVRAGGWHFMSNNIFGPQSGVSHMVQCAKDNGWKAPTSTVDGPFQRSHNVPGTDAFTYWVEKDLTSLTQLSAWMTLLQQERLLWSAWFPASSLFGQSENDHHVDDRVFMVDLGGGRGHDLNDLATRYPDRNMKLLLQDLPDVIKEAKQESLDVRIDMAEHDFFTPQPVKGANIYFMHKIMHDWNDKEACIILSHLRDAMAPDSRILLNDLIVLDQNSGLFAVASDLSMLALLSAKERSETMWRNLIDQVGGLTIKKFWRSPDAQGEGIVEVVRGL